MTAALGEVEVPEAELPLRFALPGCVLDPLLQLDLGAQEGSGQPEERELALGAGFDEHMLKPLDLQRLRQLLDRCTDESATVEPQSERGAL